MHESSFLLEELEVVFATVVVAEEVSVFTLTTTCTSVLLGTDAESSAVTVNV